MSALVGLGKAYEICFIRDGRTKSESFMFPGYWWAWSGTPDNGNILLVKPLSATDKSSRVNHDTHIKFHGDDPDKLLRVEAPALTGARRIGLVISFAYDARGFASTKSSKPYRHHFGAETHADKPPFPESALPMLCTSLSGSLIIKRRAGNGFRLADWVVG